MTTSAKIEGIRVTAEFRVEVTADDVPLKGHGTAYFLLKTVDGGGGEWTTHKRYSELREFKKDMDKVAKVRGFPGRLVKGSLSKSPTSRADLEKRARDLTDWFGALVAKSADLDDVTLARLHDVLDLPPLTSAAQVATAPPRRSASFFASPAIAKLEQDLAASRAVGDELAAKAAAMDAQRAADVAAIAAMTLELLQLRQDVEALKPKPPTSEPPSNFLVCCRPRRAPPTKSAR